LQLEYFTIADEKSLKSINMKEIDTKYRAFMAVFAGNIRLIDNIQLKNNNQKNTIFAAC
jgi:pantoate--beta-alanine ligase